MISRNNRLISSEANLLAKDAWNSNDKSGKEKGSHDGECENPLKSDCLGEKLTDPESSSEVAEGEAHGVVLENNQEEQSINQNTPDGNIRQDTSRQGVCINSNSTIPVQCNEIPCQWSRDGWDMDCSSVGIVAEVEGGKVEEIDNQEYF